MYNISNFYMYIVIYHIIKPYLLIDRLLNMQQTSFMYSQSEMKVIKGTAVQFTRSIANN